METSNESAWQKFVDLMQQERISYAIDLVPHPKLEAISDLANLLYKLNHRSK